MGYRGSPSAVCSGPGNLNLFVWGGDNRLWQKSSFDGGQTWSPWAKPLGNDGTLASTPSVCSWGPGRIDVFVIAAGAVYHRWYDSTAGGWNGGWEYRGTPPGGVQFQALASASSAPGRLDVFATAGNSLWQMSYDGNWHGWTQPPGTEGGALTSAPSSASWGPGHLAVFGRGTDSGLNWTNWFQNYWSGWQRIGVPATPSTAPPPPPPRAASGSTSSSGAAPATYGSTSTRDSGNSPRARPRAGGKHRPVAPL